MATDQIRLATYNLLHGMPVRDGMPRPEVDSSGQLLGLPEHHDETNLIRAIQELDADVIGLQEVDVNQPRSGGHHQVRVVADALGAADWRFGASVRGTPGSGKQTWEPATVEDESGPTQAGTSGPLYGVGLVSRLPVRRWATTRFSAAPFALPLLVPAHPRPQLLIVRDEPRAAIAAVIAGRQGDFTVATVHLSFVPGFNVRQLRQLQDRLKDWPRPLIVLGDFNLPGQLPARFTGWTQLLRAATYPATGPKVQLDHVLSEGLSEEQIEGSRCQVHRLEVSDHCAVTVDLDV